LSGRGLCDELITRPEESYRLWCVVVCDLETSRMGAPYIYDISCLRVKHTVGLDTAGILATMEDNSEQFEVLMQTLQRNNACYHRTVSK